MDLHSLWSSAICRQVLQNLPMMSTHPIFDLQVVVVWKTARTHHSSKHLFITFLYHHMLHARAQVYSTTSYSRDTDLHIWHGESDRMTC